MSYAVETIRAFERQAKRLQKRYPSLADDLALLIESLAEDPRQGTPLGGDVYKVRLAIRSKHGGKSGGGRVITAVVAVSDTVYLLSVFDKSERASMTKAEIKKLLGELPPP